jgi:hypothetical protein
MACFNHATIVDLTAREMLQLPDVRGTTLRVTRGILWITQQDDTQDIVLRPGDNWVVERNGITLIEAQNDATFCAIGGDLAALVDARYRRGSALLRHAGPQRGAVRLTRGAGGCPPQAQGGPFRSAADRAPFHVDLDADPVERAAHGLCVRLAPRLILPEVPLTGGIRDAEDLVEQEHLAGRADRHAAELVVCAIEPRTCPFLSRRVGGEGNAVLDHQAGAEANADLGVHGSSR